MADKMETLGIDGLTQTSEGGDEGLQFHPIRSITTLLS